MNNRITRCATYCFTSEEDASAFVGKVREMASHYGFVPIWCIPGILYNDYDQSAPMANHYVGWTEKMVDGIEMTSMHRSCHMVHMGRPIRHKSAREVRGLTKLVKSRSHKLGER